MPKCYSVDAFATAYGFNIWPCADKSTWFNVVGAPKVLPPVYEKKVGRPRKSRRKQPHEVQEQEGSKMTRHGVEMHCSHCKESGHNIAGCSKKKLGLKPKQILKRKSPPSETDNAEDHVLNQVSKLVTISLCHNIQTCNHFFFQYCRKSTASSTKMQYQLKIKFLTNGNSDESTGKQTALTQLVTQLR